MKTHKQLKIKNRSPAQTVDLLIKRGVSLKEALARVNEVGGIITERRKS